MRVRVNKTKEGKNQESLFWPKVVITTKQYNMVKKETVEKTIHNFRRHIRKKYSAEGKIRIVLEGLRDDTSITVVCRRNDLGLQR